MRYYLYVFLYRCWRYARRRKCTRDSEVRPAQRGGLIRRRSDIQLSEVENVGQSISMRSVYS